LGAMTDVDERLQAEEPCAALDRVERAEDAVQHVPVVRRRFEPEQVRIERLDELARLGEKIVEQHVVHNSSHACVPRPAPLGIGRRRYTPSSERSSSTSSCPATTSASCPGSAGPSPAFDARRCAAPPPLPA